MKKIIFLIAISLIAIAGIYAQDATSQDDVEAQKQENEFYKQIEQIPIEDIYAEYHPSAKIVQLSIEYLPSSNLARFYYKCLEGSYEQGEAMNTAIAVYEDFMIKHKYKHKKYASKDTVSYVKDKSGLKWAIYSSSVVLSK